MSEQYIDLITGRPLEPWAREAMERRSEGAPSCSIGSCRRHGKCMYVPCRHSPRAAVGEQSREVVREAIAKGLAGFIADEPDYTMCKRMIREATEYIMAQPGIFALQSPPAKVKGE